MMLQIGTRTLTPIVAVLAATLLMGQGLDTGSPTMSPSADEASPAVDTLPTAVNPDVPSATAPASPPENKAVVVPVNKPQAAAPAAPAAKKEKAAKAAKTEVLPWANTPIVPAVPGATPDPANAAAAATAAQCAGLFEAQCREVATCAWVADIKHEDGTSVAARCAGRGAAPPKKAASKPKPKPKPEATTAAATAPPSAEAPAKKSLPITVSPPAPAAEAPAQAPASDGSIVVKMPTPQ
jgi:hypothetical protein